MPLDLAHLNPAQLKAVESAGGPFMIVAGPGTGKTRTLASRAAYLIQEKGVPPDRILAVTFTRSAALEMLERLRALLPGEKALPALWLDTFHALALCVLREQEYPFGPGVPFEILTEEEKPQFLLNPFPRSFHDRQAFFRELRELKQNLNLPAEGAAAEYQKRLFAARRLDFDDLLVYACRLLEEKSAVRDSYRNRLQYVLVDEFQDTSFAQYRLLRHLAGPNLCVIGEPDQAIYGFAGEGFEPFAAFRRDYPEHGVFFLSQNYRSQSIIVEAAKQVIHKNVASIPRELEARLEQGLPVEITSYPTDRQEAELIVRKIEGLLGGANYFTIDSEWAEKESESYAYGLADIAILYRFHAQAKKIAQVLERAGIPHRIFGKNVLTPDLNPSPLPSPLGGEGRVRGPIASDDPQDYEEYVVNVSARGEEISLMTLHRAKGLEFPVVFMAGCEEGVTPYLRSQDLARQARETEEERRLFYVGITRAKRRLFISYAEKRSLFGKWLPGKPSPFVADIQAELCRLQESRPPDRKRPPQIKEPTLFD